MSKKKRNSALKKEIFSFSRLLHVYLSTFLLSLLVLFSITGITLNHRWYDSQNNQESLIERSLTSLQIEDWLLVSSEQNLQSNKNNQSNRNNQSINWEPDLTRITRDLRQEFHLPIPASVELESEFQEVILDFKVPAGFATFTLSFIDKRLVLEQEKGSVIGILNDLHKGRHSGVGWSWVLDVSAVLIVVFSITGFIILFQGKKHRKGGVVSFALGTLTPYLIYLFLVPIIGS